MIRFIFTTATVAILAGCAGSAASLPSASLQGVAQTSALHVQPVSPQTCNKRVRLAFKKTGGSFNLPKCVGWTGEMAYPSGFVRSAWGVTSSVTNDFGAPPPPSGVAIFYMRMTLVHPTVLVFHADNISDTVTTPAFTSDHTYTLNVYNFLYNDECPSSQCTWTMNIGSPQSGSHSITFVSPLNGATTSTDNNPVWQFVQN